MTFDSELAKKAFKTTVCHKHERSIEECRVCVYEKDILVLPVSEIIKWIKEKRFEQSKDLDLRDSTIMRAKRFMLIQLGKELRLIQEAKKE